MTKVSDSLTVHRASPRNLARVAELFDRYRVFYGCDPDPNRARAFIAERFRANDSVIYVAELDGTVVGFVQLLPKLSSSSMTRDWILNDLYVDDEARRHGAGKALIDEAKAFVQAAAGSKLTLKTHRDNQPAQQLYTSHGWELDDRFHTFVYRITNTAPGDN